MKQPRLDGLSMSRKLGDLISKVQPEPFVRLNIETFGDEALLREKRTIQENLTECKINCQSLKIKINVS